ncbi:2551_t:CDS:10 [Diversispora eburnea]|uniref:2551_t:CDS:1 n=1 Tax=Diversispora eburnea TaxID=1213867 RepID=A0A9N8YMN8_9GLOM|nr:2551_t:CDS:10 [Diversispora eburnea]
MPKRKQVFNNRGDNELFRDEWEDVVLAPKIDLLQHVGINLGDLPKKVYDFIKIRPEDLELFSEENGRTYLPFPRDPTSIVFSDKDSSFQVPQCESYPIRDKLNEKFGYILNFGGSVWALEWCPNISSPGEQYLAIGGYKSSVDEHHPIGRKQKTDLNQAIQIWKINCSIDNFAMEEEENQTFINKPKLDMVICHEYGCVFDMQWCPYGILAVSFGNGTIGIFSIPKPDSIRKYFGEPLDSMKPIYELSLPQTMCWTVSWGGHYKISTGCTNGDIATWNIFDILKQKYVNNVFDDPEVTYPINYMRAHDSCIRQIVWNSPTSPSHTLSCGHDGRLQIIEDRDPMFKNMFQRIRDFMSTVCWPCHYGGIVYADSDNTVRYIRMDDLRKTTGLIMHHANVWAPVTWYRIGFKEDEVTVRYYHNIKSKETTGTYHNAESFTSGGTLGLVRVDSVHRK